MDKAVIRKLRLQKQLYRLALLTLRKDLPELYFQEEPLALLIRRRSTLGVRLPDIIVEIGFPQCYPMEPVELRVNQADFTSNESTNKCKQLMGDEDIRKLPSFRSWNVGVYAADILQELVAAVRKKTLLAETTPKCKRVFAVMRDHRQQKEKEEEKVGKQAKRNVADFCSRKISKHRKREQNIETKNLNRHFRSKLREILRELEGQQARELYTYFQPNCVGFKEIRYVLNRKWFNDVMREELRTGSFLRRIEQSVMGIESKHLMIKYYHIIEHAVNFPHLFQRWKY